MLRVAAIRLGERRPVRLTALGLVSILALFVFDGAVHSVHHLTERDQLAPCAVASASLHGPAAAATVALDRLIIVADEAVTETSVIGPVHRPLCPPSGRAPPSTSV